MDKSARDRIAAEIRAEAARQRKSGRALALSMERPVTTVARWMRGANLGLDEIELFAEALGVTVVDLIMRAYGAPETGLKTPGFLPEDVIAA